MWRLYNLVWLLSLLLAVATVAVWARSRRAFDGYSHFNRGGGRYVFVGVLRGGLQVAVCSGLRENRFALGLHSLTMSPGDASWDRWQALHGPGETSDRSLLGFRLIRGDLGDGRPGDSLPFWSVRVPLWCPTVLFLIPPAVWFWRHRRSRPRREVEADGPEGVTSGSP